MKSVFVYIALLAGIVIPLQSSHAAEVDVNFDLLRASLDGNSAKIEELLTKGASINYLCRSFTPLVLAASGGNEDAVRLLVDRGAKIDQTGENGPSALTQAALKGHSRIVELLLQKGAQVNHKAGFVWNKIRIVGNNCSDLKQPGVAEELCEKEDCCMTPLCVATEENTRHILLEHGATE